MKIETECAFNVPEEYNIYERLVQQKRKHWKLYVNDHYWVLHIDGYYEFYFNPQHSIGKLKETDMPNIAVKHIKDNCIMFDSSWHRYTTGQTPILKWNTKPISNQVDFMRLEKDLTVGNWFYAQGYNYITANGRFYEICYPYDTLGREYALCDMKIDDMLRMTASTKSHYYIRSIWELECFKGLNRSEITKLIVKPLNGHLWNSSVWAEQFAFHLSTGEKSVIRFMRQEVFLHTVYLARKGKYISESGHKIHFFDQNMMMKKTELYSQRLTVPDAQKTNKTKIFVEDEDCLSSAKKWKDKGYHTAVLNMADRQNPGKGVYDGIKRQETDLFCRTNLFMSLFQFAPYANVYGINERNEHYPLDQNHGGIYTPGATVFRGVEKYGYPLLDEPYKMAFISVAGMNRPKLNANGMIVDHLVEGIKNKIRTIFNIGLLHGHDCLILGALGCGTLKNPPVHIAQLFREVIENEYKNLFRVIVFAIPKDNGLAKDHNNEAFNQFRKIYIHNQSKEEG